MYPRTYNRIISAKSSRNHKCPHLCHSKNRSIQKVVDKFVGNLWLLAYKKTKCGPTSFGGPLFTWDSYWFELNRQLKVLLIAL